MKRVVYIGAKSMKADNVAGTGLVWTRGDVHEIADDKKAAQLIEHKKVWADADKDYELEAEQVFHEDSPEPRVMIMPQGGVEVSAFWEPVTIPVTGEVFLKLQNHELVAVFMTSEDADRFDIWKNSELEKTPKKMGRPPRQQVA